MSITVFISKTVRVALLAATVLSTTPAIGIDTTAMAATTGERGVTLSLRDFNTALDKKLQPLARQIDGHKEQADRLKEQTKTAYKAMRAAEGTPGHAAARDRWLSALSSKITARNALWQTKLQDVEKRSAELESYMSRLRDRLSEMDGDTSKELMDEAAAEKRRIEADLRRFAADMMAEMAEDEANAYEAGLPVLGAEMRKITERRLAILEEPGLDIKIDPSRPYTVDKAGPLRTIMEAAETQARSLTLRYVALTDMIRGNQRLAAAVLQKVMVVQANEGTAQLYDNADLDDDI